jgi:UDP-N-acetyl-D-mannosaminuronic acid dehydrogenase
MSSVCIHGLGYIGLPTAAVLAEAGHDVFGYDVDVELLDALERGELDVDEPGLDAVIASALDGSLSVTREVVPADYHLICVPTPLEEGCAELSYVEAAGEAVATVLRPGDTVILESTVPPRTTVEVLGPVLERSGLDVGEFSLAYSPETVLPGNVIAELHDNDRAIGGVDAASVDAAAALYGSFVEGELRTMTDPTLAEFVKLLQNTYRDVNIALANEVAMIADDYDLDSREAIGLANHHPRVDLHQPGPGVGGHCIPIDPLFLGQGSDRLDLIERARAINDGMAEYVTDLLETHLGSIAGTNVAILGVAYKGNVADARESPGLRLAETLQRRARATHAPGTEGTGGAGGAGATETSIDVRLHDPHVTDSHLALESLQDALSGADAAVIATDHDEYATLDPNEVAAQLGTAIVIDAKGILDAAVWEAAGVTVVEL